MNTYLITTSVETMFNDTKYQRFQRHVVEKKAMAFFVNSWTKTTTILPQIVVDVTERTAIWFCSYHRPHPPYLKSIIDT